MTNNQFIGIGTVTNPGNAAGLAQTTTFSFADRHPVDGSNTYRIRASAVDGQSYYSPVVTVAAGDIGLSSIYLSGNSPGSVTTLVVNCLSDCRGVIVIYSPLGQVLQKRSVELYKGYNSIDLPPANEQRVSASILSLFINGQIVYTQKIIR